jgi:cbb3-type cytochrome oxidase cytochrome c subunit
MKGLQPLFLGIFGIFAFSWLGMTVVPNLQIGSLNPQTDEEGTDIYPMPPSGMVLRGARVYAANGCVYCHSQQVRPEYGGSDIERHWGERRSAPRDYIFEPIVFLGKMRIGPDLANVGHRSALQEAQAVVPPPAPAAGASPVAATTAPVGAPAASPAAAATPALAAVPPASPSAAATAGSATSPAAGEQAAVSLSASLPAAIADVVGLTASGEPLPNTAAWHHRHLYNPRSISEDSNMPAYRFLYEKRQIDGAGSYDSINFAGDEAEAPGEGWEIVPSYDAKCLVAYLMSRDQSHLLKEAKSPLTLAPALAKEAQK